MKTIHTLVVAVALGALVGAAHADVKVIQSITIDNPQFKAAMQSMSPEQRAQMSKMGLGGTMQSTTYVSGHKSRTDVGQINSVIVDSTSGKVMTLNRISHTYSTQSLSSMQAHVGKGSASIKPTGKTKVIQGHLCRDYRLSVTGNSAGSPVQITGDIWAAPDLPRLAFPMTGVGPAATLQGQWSKVNGMPLQVNMTMNGGPIGATRVTTNVTSISSTPLSASVFAIPAGFQPGPAYSNPMMGGAMGAPGR